MVLGILLCCSLINPGDLLNWMIAIALLVAGTAFVILSIVTLKALFTDTGLSGSLLIAVGVAFLPALPGGISIDWMCVIALVMMVVGCAMLLDSILGFSTNRHHSRNAVVLVLGAIFTAIGFCLWFIEEFREFAGLMLGIFFIIYSVLLLVSAITHKDYVVISVKKK